MLISLISCSKGSEATLAPTREKCQYYDLRSHSGLLLKVYRYSAYTNYLQLVGYLKLNNAGIVVDTVCVLMDKASIKTVIYNYKCYPSYF